jgi:PAS domain S-box-containing protein
VIGLSTSQTPAAPRFELLDLATDRIGPDSTPLSALAHLVPGLVFACTPDGRRAGVSRQGLQALGLPEPEAITREWPRLVHPDDLSSLPQRAADDRVEMRFRLRDASGAFRWHLARAHLLRGPDGQPQMWTGTATEIEHQAHIEQALERREREFHTLVENAPDSISWLDPQLRHLYANRAMQMAFGVSQEALIGHTPEEAGLPAAVSAAWREAAGRALSERVEQECQFSSPDRAGEEHHYICRLVPERDSQGADSVLCVAYDITHRQRALRALQDSEQRFGQFAQSSEDVFWFADLDTDSLLYVSPAFERLWGGSVASLHARPGCWTDAMHPEDRHLLPAPFYRGNADGHEPVREYRVRRPDGSEVWIRDRRFRLQQAGDGRLRIGGIAEDITERKRRDLEREDLLARERVARADAEALANTKDEFLAVVSHELRSPLNAIRGWAHVLRKTLELTPEQTRPLDAIDRNVTAQARMVDDLLDTQRLLRGKVKLELQRMPLNTVVEQAVDTFRPAAQDKPLKLTLQHTTDAVMVEADAERLRQALVNLLSNAIKFTPAEGRVEVRTRRSGERVLIDITDSGVGLEATQLSRIFEPFRQAGGSTSSTRRQGGLGLGLALARQLVELHRGALSAHSDGPDQGATFTVDLPALPEQARATPPERSGALPDLAGRRVVVLEDDPEGRQILDLLLRDESVQATFFANADEGFNHLNTLEGTERPDALISDVAMPGEDGYSFIRRVRELHRTRGEPALPAIALTAFASPSDRVRALAAGFDAHLGKPMDPEQLRSTLKELLRDTATTLDSVQR